MQTLHRNVAALIIAGRRVRTLHVSPPLTAEGVQPKKRSTSPPRSKPKSQKARDAKRQTSTRKAKDGPVENIPQAQTGLIPDNWPAGWGKDKLAPPSSSKRRTSKQRHRKSNPPSSTGPLPPHHIPYVRRTEGYISDEDQQCNNVLRDVKSPSEHKPIAQLAHGLDRVLFNQGVYWLRDPRSRIYNFTPWLESIPPVTDFAFERITGFVKSSMDDDLWKIAKQYKRSFAGSTSSLTGLLSHCYFLISGDKEVNTSSLSRAFFHQPTDFSPGQRMPTSVVLNYKEGVWLIDSDKTEELSEKNVLTWMGTMLERFLTVPEEEFKKLLRSAPVVEQDSDTRREAYRYAMSDKFVMRSQLDCVDPRLPGTGVFDIKTRAAVPIRLDILNYEENSGYLIKTLTGSLESFEKEYYDLIRSAFLKYSFQARIGNMDGVLVAYHNTARIFGFQYVSLEEMEDRLYGTGDGTRVFNKCVSLLERILSDVVSIHGERSVKCTFETRELMQEFNVWIQPVEWDEQVEGKPCPITELGIRVKSYLGGQEVKGAQAVSDGRGWVTHWTLTESALEEAEIRRRLEGAQDRQFRALNFPVGIQTIEEMEKVWAKIDFGGKKNAQEIMAVIKDLESRPKHAGSESAQNEQEPTQDGNDAATSDPVEATQELSLNPSQSHTDSPSFPTPYLAFREPDRNIRQLRQLALQGREETLREEAEGREKVVWGCVDGLVERAGWINGCGTLPGGGEVSTEALSSGEALQVGGVTVGGGDGEGGGERTVV